MHETICIISGSTLGSAEYLAEHCDDVLQQQGFKTALFHGPDWQQVKDYQRWLVVTSTHGAGDLPDNLYPLFDQLEAEADQLSGLSFAVIGLGNSDYDTFCFSVDKIEKMLTQKQALQLCDGLKIDVLNCLDHDQAADGWLPQFIEQLKKVTGK
ncbi:MioC protein [Pasteurella testudinis DSM 23072]|uniref:MioC protein n=1 Tax=Pasteurella testudinis DSM 23072 TaxID=1122938 RepID=A0A1W1V2F9_9PAST|nr:FMN-binding protein MioC [Pasteurella testudinis]SMB87539.1 MioC protein [Pasteurella testudinis DSM 23072]SUB50519.1 protein MioC [Pasteurella testudinis]